jgi:hypothetical protein
VKKLPEMRNNKDAKIFGRILQPVWQTFLFLYIHTDALYK